MKYEFPIIENISDVLSVIEGRDEFYVAEKDGYKVINYHVNFSETFPPVKVSGGSAKLRAERARQNSILRECRGIIFHADTGEILRRPYHKFFNIGEKPETYSNQIDLSEPNHILEKLDGSMIAPFLLDGKLIWGTKMGATDVAEPVEEFVKNNPQYIEFGSEMIAAGLTPIFEWCSRRQRIVMDYPEDMLILTAMRQINNGRYLTREALLGNAKVYNIPVVQQFECRKDIQAFIEHTRNLTDTEGYVVRFADGHMVKMKCDWYVTLHKTVSKMTFEKDVLELIFRGQIDDVKPLLHVDKLASLEEFEKNVLESFWENLNMVWETANEKFHSYGSDRRAYAMAVKDHVLSPLFFKAYDMLLKGDVKEQFAQYVLNYAIESCSSSNRVENIRHLIGNHRWN